MNRLSIKNLFNMRDRAHLPPRLVQDKQMLLSPVALQGNLYLFRAAVLTPLVASSPTPSRPALLPSRIQYSQPGLSVEITDHLVQARIHKIERLLHNLQLLSTPSTRFSRCRVGVRNRQYSLAGRKELLSRP